MKSPIYAWLIISYVFCEQGQKWYFTILNPIFRLIRIHILYISILPPTLTTWGCHQKKKRIHISISGQTGLYNTCTLANIQFKQKYSYVKQRKWIDNKLGLISTKLRAKLFWFNFISLFEVWLSILHHSFFCSVINRSPFFILVVRVPCTTISTWCQSACSFLLLGKDPHTSGYALL